MKADFDFHQLEQFLAVARSRNFTRAAENLNLSQPALSRSIQKLEDQIGKPLFERRPREIVLTDLGELLLERARTIVALVEDTSALLSEASRHGRVRLGAIPTIAPYFLPRMLGEFSGSHPDISVVVIENTTERLVSACLEGDIDLAVLALPLPTRSAPLAVEALFDEELLLVLPASHPLGDYDEIGAEAVEEFPLVMLNEDHCLSENIATYCRKRSIQPVKVERISQLATVQELVALGHGVSIVPEMARRLDRSDSRVYRSFAGERPTRTVGMMWNPHRRQSAAMIDLMDSLRAQGPAISETAPPTF